MADETEDERLEKLAVVMRKELKIQINATTDKLIGEGYKFTVAGTEYMFDTSDKSLSRLEIVKRAAQTAKDAGQPFVYDVILKDGSTLLMDRDDIISNVDAMFVLGLQMYAVGVALMKSVDALKYYELVYWIDPRA